MDVLIPLLAFLVGLGVHRWLDRFCKAWAVVVLRKTVEDLAVRREELRFEARLLDPVAIAEHLQRQDVRREIEQLIQDTKR